MSDDSVCLCWTHCKPLKSLLFSCLLSLHAPCPLAGMFYHYNSEYPLHVPLQLPSLSSIPVGAPIPFALFLLHAFTNYSTHYFARPFIYLHTQLFTRLNWCRSTFLSSHVTGSWWTIAEVKRSPAGLFYGAENIFPQTLLSIILCGSNSIKYFHLSPVSFYSSF